MQVQVVLKTQMICTKFWMIIGDISFKEKYSRGNKFQWNKDLFQKVYFYLSLHLFWFGKKCNKMPQLCYTRWSPKCQFSLQSFDINSNLLIIFQVLMATFAGEEPRELLPRTKLSLLLWNSWKVAWVIAGIFHSQFA